MYGTRQQPDTAARFNDHTLYIASRHLTVRYKKEQSLYDMLSKRLSAFESIDHQITFHAKFVVTDKGEVAHVRIINSISDAYDNAFIKQIKKTSGDWHPVKIGNAAVYCEMNFEVKYLGSLNPNLGRISTEKSR